MANRHGSPGVTSSSYGPASSTPIHNGGYEMGRLFLMQVPERAESRPESGERLQAARGRPSERWP